MERSGVAHQRKWFQESKWFLGEKWFLEPIPRNHFLPATAALPCLTSSFIEPFLWFGERLRPLAPPDASASGAWHWKIAIRLGPSEACLGQPSVPAVYKGLGHTRVAVGIQRTDQCRH